ncbi:MAG TPA: CocE/NonD family hydrolase [Streptosporangiaceae bacterium]|nr:CocE/NonD family hydrolase [Streptosporangiaceae bacterium]HVB41072.1 CocE/NonD family hydrolase [Streptosporangiaceae bacterium]
MGLPPRGRALRGPGRRRRPDAGRRHSARRSLPARRERPPLPVVLIRSPYGRAGIAAILLVAPLARRGFQVFIQSTCGTFGSGGQFRPFLSEHEDGLATVAWLRDQSWCDGEVSMTGSSYLGHTQWAVAPYIDPPLRSVSLNITAAKITAALRPIRTWSGPSAPASSCARSLSTPTCSSGSATSTPRASPATSWTASGGSARSPARTGGRDQPARQARDHAGDRDRRDGPVYPDRPDAGPDARRGCPA